MKQKDSLLSEFIRHEADQFEENAELQSTILRKFEVKLLFLYYPHDFWKIKMRGYCNLLRLCLYLSVRHAISSETVVYKFTKLGGYDHHMARSCESSVILALPQGWDKRVKSPTMQLLAHFKLKLYMHSTLGDVSSVSRVFGFDPWFRPLGVWI